MKSLKGIMLCVLMYVTLGGLGARIEEWQWYKTAGGVFHDIGRSIATDNEGNSYIVGEYTGIATFGNNSYGSYNTRYSFIAKLNSAGEWLWVNSMAIIGSYVGNRIILDSNNNIYLSGYFSGTITCGTTTLTSSGQEDILVAKMDSNGNCLWAVKAGGIGEDIARDIALDTTGNIYIIGEFSDAATFGSLTLVSPMWADGFIAKLDDSGNWLWVNQLVTDWSLYCYGISLDSSNNLYVTGSFNGSAVFGSATLTSNVTTYYDIFVTKLSSSGSWIWAQKAGGSYSDAGFDIVTDESGCFYLTGYFTESANFGSFVLNTPGGYVDQDLFVAQADSNGNWINATRFGTAGNDRGNSIALDRLGNVFVTGEYGGDVVFGKLDSNLNWLWTKTHEHPGQEWGNDITVDMNSNIYATGCAKDTGNWDEIFVCKLGYKSPVAYFESDITEGYAPLSVQFIDHSLPGNAPLTSWTWDFGDSNSSLEQNPSHIYSSPGMYSVSLTVANVADSTDTLIKTDYICALPRNPIIDFPNTTHDFGITYLGSFVEKEIWIKNTGPATLTISSITLLQTNSSFSVPQYNPLIDIAEGDSTMILVTFTPQRLGTVSDSLFIFNNSVNMPVVAIRLTGTGDYVPPNPPGDVSIVMNNNNAIITWAAVTQTTYGTPFVPDYYLIFNNGSSDPENGPYCYHGLSTTLQYTHYQAGLHAHQMFYRVVAYKYYGRGICELSALKPGMSEAEVLRILRILGQ